MSYRRELECAVRYLQTVNPKCKQLAILPLRVSTQRGGEVGLESKQWRVASILPILSIPTILGSDVRAGCCMAREHKLGDSWGKSDEKQGSALPAP